MDTNSASDLVGTKVRHYRSHSPEFKRQVIEASYQPGTSVAKVAQAYGINANQLFAWRKTLRDDILSAKPADVTTFLPVRVDHGCDAGVIQGTTPLSANGHADSVGRMEIVVGKARLTIYGAPDAATLQTVLSGLIR